MNNVETIEFSTANLERLAFYFKNLKMEVLGSGENHQKVSVGNSQF